MHKIVSREKWLEYRKRHLAEEKEFTRLRDELSSKRRQMPWVIVEEDYEFIGGTGKVQLSELFGAHSQLIIYHFMFGDGWGEGCPSCSFWADNFNGIAVHLAARDAAFGVVSIAPWEQLAAYKKRMGWEFTWVSSAGNSFNHDYFVSFSDEDIENGSAVYNYKKSTFPGNEAAGISVFARGERGKIYHTYSTFSRGLDMMNGAYHYMDLLPKGRDEDALSFSMGWLKRHDQY